MMINNLVQWNYVSSKWFVVHLLNVFMRLMLRLNCYSEIIVKFAIMRHNVSKFASNVRRETIIYRLIHWRETGIFHLIYWLKLGWNRWDSPTNIFVTITIKYFLNENFLEGKLSATTYYLHLKLSPDTFKFIPHSKWRNVHKLEEFLDFFQDFIRN